MRKPRFATRTGVLLAAAVLLVPAVAVACGDDEESGTTTTTEAEAAAPTVTDAWARQVQENGAVYMVITGGDEDDALVDAKVPTDVAAQTQIHETVMADDSMEGGSMDDGSMSGSSTTAMGMETEDMGEETTTSMAGDTSGDADATTTTMAGKMTMQEVDQIDIPAGEKVELKPGGYHVMMLDMQKTLTVGEKIQVTLTFEKAGEITVEAEVKEA